MIGHGFWGGPVGWGVVAGLASLAVLTLMVVPIASLIRKVLGAGLTVGSRAIRILEERYAGGEISREEFLKRRAILSGSVPDPRRTASASGATNTRVGFR